jgi:hypothetical protein
MQNVRLFSSELSNLIRSFSFPSVVNLGVLQTLLKSFSLNFSLFNIYNYNSLKYNSEIKNTTFNFPKGIINISMHINKDTLQMYSEGSSSQRVTRFNTIFVNYDYKTGHYLGNWDSFYPFLMNSFVEVAKGIKKPC